MNEYDFISDLLSECSTGEEIDLSVSCEQNSPTQMTVSWFALVVFTPSSDTLDLSELLPGTNIPKSLYREFGRVEVEWSDPHEKGDFANVASYNFMENSPTGEGVSWDNKGIGDDMISSALEKFFLPEEALGIVEWYGEKCEINWAEYPERLVPLLKEHVEKVEE